MKTSRLRRLRPQRGMVLFIALIVLVAMTLASIGMLRSVDATNLIAGNLAFKQGTVNAADLGIDAAQRWLQDRSGTGVLPNDQTASGYFSSRPAPEPDWTAAATWANQQCVVAGCAADPVTGNIVSYVIHRMCTLPNTVYNGAQGTEQNQCAFFNVATGGGGGLSDFESTRVFEQKLAASGAPGGGGISTFFRITTRVRGPRDTLSVVQAMVMLPE